MPVYFVRLCSGSELHIRAAYEIKAIEEAIEIEKTRLEENGCEKIFPLPDEEAAGVFIDND